MTVGGRLALTLDLDGSRFDPGGSTVGRLTLSGQAGLSLDLANPVGAGTRPDVLVTLGVPDVGAVRLGVGLRPDGTVGVTLAVHPRGRCRHPAAAGRAGPGSGRHRRSPG